MNGPRAIETRYAGRRFRSRLEARWAVFLEALKIPWDYERQGFALAAGPYLPDFWLWPGTTHERIIEVKPDEPIDMDARWFEMANEVGDATGSAFYIGAGLPSRHSFRWVPALAPDDPRKLFGGELRRCFCGHVRLLVLGGLSCSPECQDQEYRHYKSFDDASVAAREERFESAMRRRRA